MLNVTCNSCGTVAFLVTRAYAIKEIIKFGNYYDSLPTEHQRSHYGGIKSYIEDYEKCSICEGSHRNFRTAVEGDCPDGCTLSPIIGKEE